MDLKFLAAFVSIHEYKQRDLFFTEIIFSPLSCFFSSSKCYCSSHASLKSQVRIKECKCVEEIYWLLGGSPVEMEAIRIRIWEHSGNLLGLKSRSRFSGAMQKRELWNSSRELSAACSWVTRSSKNNVLNHMSNLGTKGLLCIWGINTFAVI